MQRGSPLASGRELGKEQFLQTPIFIKICKNMALKQESGGIVVVGMWLCICCESVKLKNLHT
jgi:hypothetical protein